MKTLSGSTRIVRPKWYGPAPSQVYAVERWCRCEPSSESSFASAMTAPTNEIVVEVVAIQPVTRRGIRVPPSVISSAATSGESRQTQAATITASSPAQRLQPVDVEWQAPPRHGDDQAEADDDLGRRDPPHRDRQDPGRGPPAG